jgi:hypothetical protein
LTLSTKQLTHSSHDRVISPNTSPHGPQPRQAKRVEEHEKDSKRGNGPEHGDKASCSGEIEQKRGCHAGIPVSSIRLANDSRPEDTVQVV